MDKPAKAEDKPAAAPARTREEIARIGFHQMIS